MLSSRGRPAAAEGTQALATLCRLADVLGVGPTNSPPSTLDKRTRGLQARQGMIQRELAEQLDMPASTLAAIETGRRPLGDEQAAGLRHALRVTTEKCVRPPSASASRRAVAGRRSSRLPRPRSGQLAEVGHWERALAVLLAANRGVAAVVFWGMLRSAALVDATG